MKKLILQMQMSVDGFVGANDDHRWQLWEWGDDIGWDEELKQDFNTVFAGIDTILLSRKNGRGGLSQPLGQCGEEVSTRSILRLRPAHRGGPEGGAERQAENLAMGAQHGGER